MVDEELMPHRKKAKKKTPKKYDHKHQFQPCVIEYIGEDFSKERGMIPVEKTAIREYCTVCGKIRTENKDRWWTEVWHFRNGSRFAVGIEPNEEQLCELDPVTRTLPTFKFDKNIWFLKAVDVDKKR